MKPAMTTLRATLLPPPGDISLRTLLDVWMLRLEASCGLPREDILLYFRYRLLGPGRSGKGTLIRGLPAHPDELTLEELFTFMWKLRRVAKSLMRVNLDFCPGESLDSYLTDSK